MANYIVVGKSERVVTAVLQAVYGFTDAKCIVIGNVETRKLRWSSLCAQHVHAEFDGSEDARVVGLINALYEEMPHVVVIPADSEGIRLVSRIKMYLHPRVTPIPELPTFNLMDDKWAFYKFCRDNDLAVPSTFYIGSKDRLDFDEVVAALGLPFVLKPANESGSLGVQIIRDREHYLRAVLHNDNYQFRTLIAQRYIDGEDIDLSLLAMHGRLSAFAIQQSRGTTIEFVPNLELEQMAAALCANSAYHGVMHIDARLEKDTGKIFLIESNPRFWASLTASVSCGLNFVAESIEETSRANGVRRLTAGTAYTRHPLLRPASWSSLLRDSGQRGRLARAATLDMYSLGRFGGDLPLMAVRYLGKRAARRGQPAKNA
jgi:predicted ATP-grasp superfamily ATP-dependent carboligase